MGIRTFRVETVAECNLLHRLRWTLRRRNVVVVVVETVVGCSLLHCLCWTFRRFRLKIFGRIFKNVGRALSVTRMGHVSLGGGLMRVDGSGRRQKWLCLSMPPGYGNGRAQDAVERRCVRVARSRTV